MVQIRIRRYFCLLLTVTLVACQSPRIEDEILSSSTLTLTVENPTVLPTFTLEPSNSGYDPIIDPFDGPTSESILPKFPLSGYVMTFLKKGELSFQDGDNLPVKLSHIGETPVVERGDLFSPQISSDNKKIFFQKFDGNEYIMYTINVNGTEEQTVFPNDWLISLETGTKKHIFGFIPHTHKLLVVTYLCNSQDAQYHCSVNLFVADTDTNDLNNLAIFDMPYSPLYDRNIAISPDGKMIAVGNTDGLVIFSLDGRIVRENILPYTPAIGAVRPLLFWLPDSSGLVLMLPDKIYDTRAYDNVIAYSVWRYLIADNNKTQIPMDVFPMAREIEVSPDGKWGVYGGFGAAERSLYLADLINGHVQIFGEEGQSHFSWAPDSKHFAFGVALENIRSVDNPFSNMAICSNSRWIDHSHLICIGNELDGSRVHMAEINEQQVKFYNLGFDKDIEYKFFINMK